MKKQESQKSKGKGPISRRSYKYRGQLSSKGFDETVVLFPKMKEDMMTACRLVLVEGFQDSDAAKSIKVTRQLVARHAANIYRTYLTEILKCPEEWRVETFCLPPELVDEFQRMIEQAKLDYYKGAKEEGNHQ